MEPAPVVFTHQGWTCHDYKVAASTNLLAASLPVWNAVRAETQTSGRGRFQRAWVSDRGGLWLSAVVPTGPGPEWKCLPLVAGLAICDALGRFGMVGTRLRWPNDVLVGDRKLAGLLLDQFAPGAAVVGIGVNVHNHPEEQDAFLKGKVVRVADLLPNPPALTELTVAILHELRMVVTGMQAGDFRALLLRVNALWGGPRLVELDLDGQLRRGRFTGVDDAGKLILTGEGTASVAYEPHQVKHLTEL
jgi:BirA family biotin operon repressor/biotin-[acetyl-CoA-carboxylase] ligase